MNRLFANHSNLSSWMVAAIILILVALVMAPNLISELPDRDAGVFLYIGSRILEGKVPYRDIWDHKGPLIYYINALGIALTPGSEAGIWTLEAITLGLSGIGLYLLLRRSFGNLSASLSVVLFYVSLAYVLYPGNYTEEFSLPIQVGALLFFSRWEQERGGALWPFLIGLTGATIFLLRLNNTGINLSITLFIISSRVFRDQPHRGLMQLFYMGGGALVLLLPVLAYLVAARALPDMFDSVVRFNSVYIQATPKARLDSILEGFKLLSPSGLPVFSIAVWSMVALRLATNRDRSTEMPLVRLAIIGLPVELIMVALSGRSLNHYFMAWLPICAVLSARFFQHVLGSSVGGQSKPETGIDPRYVWAVGLAAVMLLLPLRRLLPPFFYFLNNGARDAFTRAANLAQYEEEYLLMWGAESTFNFLTGKPSPTKYVFQFPLYTCGYVTEKMAEGFRREVVLRRPLIVDSSLANPAVPPVNVDERREWSQSSDSCALTVPMLELLSYIDANYEYVSRMSYTGWPIYRVSD